MCQNFEVKLCGESWFQLKVTAGDKTHVCIEGEEIL
jgi:hypothetical protein